MTADSQNLGTILVTGGGRGIGAGICKAAAAAGYAVVVNFVNDEAAAQSVVNGIQSVGGRACSVKADVANEEDVERLFDVASEQSAPLTAVVCNAGISGQRRPLVETTVADLRQTIDVNLMGTLLCAQAALRRMERGGIVFLGSQAAERGGNNLAAYAAAKGAVHVLTKALARETGSGNVRVNAVSPGIIATDQQPLDDADWVQDASAGIPLGRLGTPEDVAGAVLWLLSDAAAYVTGTVVAVNGGR